MRDLTPGGSAADTLRERHGELVSRVLEILGEPELLRAGDRIHDLRVATKKLRAIYGMLCRLPDSDRLRPLSRVLRRVARRASDLRDLQVHIGLVLELSNGERSRLVPWLDELFARERLAAAALEGRAPKLARRIFKRNPSFGRLVPDDASPQLRRLAAKFCTERREEVVAALLRNPAESELHQVRKWTKRWVHGEEIRTSLFGAAPTDESKLARSLASALGRWHDAVRGVEILDKRIRRGSESEDDAAIVATLLGLHRAFESERERQLERVSEASHALLREVTVESRSDRTRGSSRSRTVTTRSQNARPSR